MPEKLRKRVLFDKVLENLREDTIPTRADEVRLYNALAEQLGLIQVIKDVSTTEKIDIDELFADEKNINEQISKVGRGEESKVGEDIAKIFKDAKPPYENFAEQGNFIEMNKDFITIREATKLTGKADITIRRLIKQLIKQNDPEATQMIRRERAGGGFVYKINRDCLLKELKISEPTKKLEDKEEFVDKTAEKQQTERLETTEVLRAKNETINLLKSELYKKDGQLKTKDWQIGSLGKKIDNLIERDRETNILLKGLQDKVFMLGAPKTFSDENSEAGTKESQKTENRPIEVERSKKQTTDEEERSKEKKKGF